MPSNDLHIRFLLLDLLLRSIPSIYFFDLLHRSTPSIYTFHRPFSSSTAWQQPEAGEIRSENLGGCEDVQLEAVQQHHPTLVQGVDAVQSAGYRRGQVQRGEFHLHEFKSWICILKLSKLGTFQAFESKLQISKIGNFKQFDSEAPKLKIANFRFSLVEHWNLIDFSIKWKSTACFPKSRLENLSVRKFWTLQLQ